jgi:hypothetical protein
MKHPFLIILIAVCITGFFSCKKNAEVSPAASAQESTNSIASCTNTFICTLNKAAMVQIDTAMGGFRQYDNTNYVNYPTFKAESWFFSTHTFISRSLIKFNLPPNFFNGFTFCQADLILHEDRDPNSLAFLGFDPYTVNQTNNRARIVRIRNTWGQNTVTWNTQPLTTNTSSALVSPIGTGTSYSSPDNRTINITAIMNDVQTLGFDRGIEILIPANNTSLAARQFGSKYPIVSSSQAQLVFYY